MIGEGIKQIPAYKCALAYDELENLRKDFWATKKGRVWMVLKTCCEADARKKNKINHKLVSAKEFLNAEELQCVGNNMKCVIALSNPDHFYNIPNFCLVDPVYEKDFSPSKNIESKIKEMTITVIVCYIFKCEENSITLSNKSKGKDLKKMYSELKNLPLDKYRLRLLFKGQEIQDDHSLFYHNVENNARIQVSIAEL